MSIAIPSSRLRGIRPPEPEPLEIREGLVLAYLPETAETLRKIAICEQQAFLRWRGMKYIVAKDPDWEPRVRELFSKMCRGDISPEEIREF
jgi:hypothetical protein